mmetsp:Transcript_19685/g.36740  ORF Transcript_19685/g.36740 Transcript_19685/m.36740 type:complete len:88 (+) Transcript_19685:273-536(+)
MIIKRSRFIAVLGFTLDAEVYKVSSEATSILSLLLPHPAFLCPIHRKSLARPADRSFPVRLAVDGTAPCGLDAGGRMRPTDWAADRR